MRRFIVTPILAVALAIPAHLPAQAGGATPIDHQGLPRAVRQEVVDRWNATSPTALRSTGRLEIEDGREVVGDVMVRQGPLLIAGRVRGSVLAINADVTLQPGARVDGDLLVVGGRLDSRGGNTSRVGGTIRIYRQRLVYREETGGEQMVAVDGDQTADDNWWRLDRRHEGNWSEALRVVQAGPYNRVEGLPIELGPALHRRTPWGSVSTQAAAIVRTGSSFNSDRGDAGYKLQSEIRVGEENDRGAGFGAKAFSTVDPVENWQLSDLEVALAAFVWRRDYRDYYDRHGGSAFATFYGAHNVSVTGSYGEERWASRDRHDPLTLLHGDDAWRLNPAVDEGLFHIATMAVQFDSRNDPEDPWSGWWLKGNVEHGNGTLTSVAPASAFQAPPQGDVSYVRGFLDLRRYTRLGPDAQLNMRVVLGGWLSGDPLPLERRLSVDGPGALPGFGFRGERTGVDVATCNGPPLQPPVVSALPAACDRIALGQIEYRGDLRFDFFSNWEDWPRRYRSEHGDAVWVLFADAGRGWRVGPPDGAITYSSGALPPLATFRTDMGLGLDFGGIGIYAAKSISTSSEPVTFFLRLRHRF